MQVKVPEARERVDWVKGAGAGSNKGKYSEKIKMRMQKYIRRCGLVEQEVKSGWVQGIGKRSSSSRVFIS